MDARGRFGLSFVGDSVFILSVQLRRVIFDPLSNFRYFAKARVAGQTFPNCSESWYREVASNRLAKECLGNFVFPTYLLPRKETSAIAVTYLSVGDMRRMRGGHWDSPVWNSPPSWGTFPRFAGG